MDAGLPALALAAGMLAAVNPCGFALLPAYLSLLVTGTAGGEVDDRRRSVLRALGATAAMTVGFVGVFAVFGLLVAPVAGGVQRHLPWFTLVLGLGLVVLGAAMVAGRTPGLPRLPRLPGRAGPPRVRRPLGSSPGSVVGFGAGYALASLTCTVAPFLAVVVGGLRAGSLLDGLVLFVAYGLGMGLVVGAVAVSVSLASGELVRRVRASGAWVGRLAGVLLVLSGGYVAWYAGWELRVLQGGAVEDPVVDAAAAVQRALAGGVDAVGPLGWLVVGAAVVAVGLLAGRRRRRRGGPDRVSSGGWPAP